MEEYDIEKNSARSSSRRRRELSGVTSSYSGRESSALSANKNYTSGMIAAASRPVTQQGLTGLRPTQTAGSGLNRQYHDKRYYISKIQGHMRHITEEINRLTKQIAENKLDATNYEECKRQAEDYTKQLANHEETLIVHNTAIESSMFKGNRSDIDADAEKLRRSNQQKISQLESIFSDKLAREEQLQKLDQQIDLERQLFNDMISTFPEHLRQEYQSLRRANEQYKTEEETIRNDMKALRKAISVHEQRVVQSELRRMRYNLLTKLHELTGRCDKLVEERKVKRTPSEEREHLLEQVKQDRADVDSFKAQREELKADLEALKERQAELEDELSDKNSARLNKYRELLKRQETMDTFLTSFQQLYADQILKLKHMRATIVYSLEYISGNSVDSSFEDMATASTLHAAGASKDDLLQEYKKLAAQKSMLDSIYTRFQNEFENTKKQKEQYIEELKTFKNIDQARDDLIERQTVLESQKDAVKSVLQATRSAVAEAEKRKADIETQLKFNEAYNMLNELEHKLDSMTDNNETQRVAINNIKLMDNFEQFRSSCLYLVQDMLIHLTEKLAHRK